MSVIGQRIKELRTGRGFSQSKVGNDLGVSQSTLGNYEADIRKPDAEMLVRLADYFDVTTDYLLGRTGNPHSYVKIAPTEHGDAIVEKSTPDELTPQELAQVRRLIAKYEPD